MESSTEFEHRVVTVAQAIAKTLGRRGALKSVSFTCSGPGRFDLVAARFHFSNPANAAVFFMAPPRVWLSSAADGLAARFEDFALPTSAHSFQYSLHDPMGSVSREEPPVLVPPHPLPWRVDVYFGA